MVKSRNEAYLEWNFMKDFVDRIQDETFLAG